MKHHIWSALVFLNSCWVYMLWFCFLVKLQPYKLTYLMFTIFKVEEAIVLSLAQQRRPNSARLSISGVLHISDMLCLIPFWVLLYLVDFSVQFNCLSFFFSLIWSLNFCFGWQWATSPYVGIRRLSLNIFSCTWQLCFDISHHLLSLSLFCTFASVWTFNPPVMYIPYYGDWRGHWQISWVL